MMKVCTARIGKFCIKNSFSESGAEPTAIEARLKSVAVRGFHFCKRRFRGWNLHENSG
jgi:hypothetical protein